jgi:hypothetical protein
MAQHRGDHKRSAVWDGSELKGRLRRDVFLHIYPKSMGSQWREYRKVVELDMVLEAVPNEILAAGLWGRTQRVATLYFFNITAKVYTFLYSGYSPLCKGAYALQLLRLLSVEHCACRVFCHNA